MNRSGDDNPDMTTIHGDLDEQAIDALLGACGGAIPAEFHDVAVLFTQLRDVIDAPAVPASPALAAMLAHGLPAARLEPRARTTSTRPGAWRRARRGALAVGLSALIGLPAVGVAAAQDRLPDWAQDMVETLLEATTPFELPDRSQAGDHAEQETRPSLTGRSDPRLGPADRVQAGTGPATLDPQETTGGADRDAKTTPAATGSQPLDAQRTHRDASQARSDPATTPQPTTVTTVSPSSSPTPSPSLTPVGGSGPTGTTASPAPAGSSEPASASPLTAIPPAPSVRQTEAPATTP